MEWVQKRSPGWSACSAEAAPVQPVQRRSRVSVCGSVVVAGSRVKSEVCGFRRFRVKGHVRDFTLHGRGFRFLRVSHSLSVSVLTSYSLI